MAVTTYGGVATRAAKLTSRIPQIIAELDPKTMDAVVELAERVVEGAKERVPDDTPIGVGLISAIHVETGSDLVKSTEIVGPANPEAVYSATELSDSAVAVVAGDHDHFYGHILEHGGLHTAPHPFLVPAYEAERENLNDIVSEHLKDL